MRLRQGRHNDRIVYHQLGDEPADTDPMVATFFSAEQARMLIAEVNYWRSDMPLWWDQFADGGE